MNCVSLPFATHRLPPKVYHTGIVHLIKIRITRFRFWHDLWWSNSINPVIRQWLLYITFRSAYVFWHFDFPVTKQHSLFAYPSAWKDSNLRSRGQRSSSLTASETAPGITVYNHAWPGWWHGLGKHSRAVHLSTRIENVLKYIYIFFLSFFKQTLHDVKWDTLNNKQTFVSVKIVNSVFTSEFTKVAGLLSPCLCHLWQCHFQECYWWESIKDERASTSKQMLFMRPIQFALCLWGPTNKEYNSTSISPQGL